MLYSLQATFSDFMQWERQRNRDAANDSCGVTTAEEAFSSAKRKREEGIDTIPRQAKVACSDLNQQRKEESPFAQYPRQTHWCYADYKRVRELLPALDSDSDDDNQSSRNSMLVQKVAVGMDWSCFGEDCVGMTGEDATLWIGTEESHTPLHYDT